VVGGSSGTGLLDLGPLSYDGVARRPNVTIKSFEGHFVAATTFGLDVTGVSRTGRTVSVNAYLTTPGSRCVIRVDGVALGQLARRIGDRIPVGAVSWHRLEIDIPTNITENDGLLISAVQFDVVPN
jgi:hypothetical protein